VGTPSGVFNPSEYLEQQLGRPIDHETVNRERRERFHTMVSDEQPMPGVEALIREAKSEGMALGVASSADREWVHGHLRNHGLFDVFDVIRTVDDVLRGKPAPDLYQAVLDALNVPGHEAVALEDSPNGLHAAKAAGMYAAAVPNSVTRHYDLGAADLIIDSLAQIRLNDLCALKRPPG
jgi:HAD superfamily hydrolase (TIGR01509 family)